MARTLEELATYLKGRLIGDGTIAIHGLNNLGDAGSGELIFAQDADTLKQALASAAAAILVPTGVNDLRGRSGIQVPNPKLAFALLLELFHPEPTSDGRVHPTAVLGQDAQLGANISIGPHAVLGNRVAVGEGTVIGAGVYVGDDAVIGERCVLDPNVVVYRRTVIGRRVLIHGGSVIGGDGFGYVFHEGQHVKIPQVGNVVIEDDVEIGCNVCIDRATIGSTLVQQGTKIDNLVQIAHNDRIGKHVVMAGQVGLSGSVSIGDYTMMGGKAGIVDHITIGPQSRIGAASVVTKSFGPKQTLWGYPARPIEDMKEQMALTARLPVLRKAIAELEKRLSALEGRRNRRSVRTK